MASLNRPLVGFKTHEGGPAARLAPLDALKRTVLTCMLWEDGFYEDGQTVAERFNHLVGMCKPEDVRALALQARNDMKLRHAPLLLVREMAFHFGGKIVGDTLRDVIQRPDELTEFLAIYWRTSGDNPRKTQPLSKQVKRGLAEAFTKFDAYQLAKYNRDGAVKLRDVLFLVHAKPKNEEQAAVWKALAEGTLESPDTWEVALSGGADKRDTFTRLMYENKLGYMALLRNLRNMYESGVSKELVARSLLQGSTNSKALPFRFIAAARAVPQWEDIVDKAMLLAMDGLPTLPGRTVLLVDVSGSMDDPLSAKSDLRRLDAACGLAVLLRSQCEEVAIATFSESTVLIPPRHGMALRDAIVQSQAHSGTYLGRSVGHINAAVEGYDRIIVITDEQSRDAVPNPKIGAKGYIINVATNQYGISNGAWTKINGFSEAVVKYIAEIESQSSK